MAEVLRIGRQIARGLAFAHAKGVIHRDVKPANIWLEEPPDEPDGAGRGRVRLLDFGLARGAADAGLTASGAVLGTPAYMAPEQARGEPTTPASDLFCLGAVLYRMCSGRLPFPGANALVILSALATRDPLPVRELAPEVPPALAALVMGLLTKDPAGRPGSARAVAERLLAIEQELAAPPVRSRRRWGLPVALTVLVLMPVVYFCGRPVIRFVTNTARSLISSLVTSAEPRNRDVEAEHARARSAARFPPRS